MFRSYILEPLRIVQLPLDESGHVVGTLYTRILRFKTRTRIVGESSLLFELGCTSHDTITEDVKNAVVVHTDMASPPL